ncbi:hypothetical protein D3C85_859510 [compost metagenome]
MQSLRPAQPCQAPAGDKGLALIAVLLVPGQALLLAGPGLLKASQLEQGPALIVVEAGQPAAHLIVGTAFGQGHRQLMPAALLLQRGGDGHHVGRVYGEPCLPQLEPELPPLLEQRPGAGLVAGRVECPPPFQQGAQPCSRGGVGEAGFYLVEQLVGLCKLTLQGVGTGDLGEQLQLVLQVVLRLFEQASKTQGSGGGILIIPLRHEIGRIVHLASWLVTLSPRCLSSIGCTRGARHRAPLRS